MSHARAHAFPSETPATAYRPFARFLHWAMAVLILSTIPVGTLMVMPGWSRATGDALFIYHKNVGVILLILLVIRFAYRLMNPPAPLPASVPPLQQLAAHATHWALYLLVLVMAVSGYVRVKAGGFPLEGLDALGVPPLVPPNEAVANTASMIHYWTRFVLILVILMHVGAALFHGIVKRDGVFSRMWPGGSGR